MKVITAPEQYEIKENDICCFLAGGISGCPNWQNDVISALKCEDAETGLDDLIIFNPRREVYTPGISSAYEQISWEFKHLSRMDIFSMYFRNESIQPICLYELGRYVEEMQYRFPYDYWKRIIISIDPKYIRIDDVVIQVNLAMEPDVPDIRAFDSSSEDHAQRIIRAYNYIRRAGNDKT